MREIIRQNMENLGFSADAREFLVGLWDTTQFFDDVKDDGPFHEDFDRVLWFLLVEIHQNPFFQRNSWALVPVIATAICKWNGANQIEDNLERDEKSFMWRAGFYDVVMAAAIADRGLKAAQDAAPFICKMYGENFHEYMMEGEDG